MGEEAVVSARRQFGRKNSDWEFPIHFLGDEDELCQYCIHAFFSDRDNVAGYASMCQMMMHAPDELRAAIIAFYRSL
jgi:hypothetical protein